MYKQTYLLYWGNIRWDLFQNHEKEIYIYLVILIRLIINSIQMYKVSIQQPIFTLTLQFSKAITMIGLQTLVKCIKHPVTI